MNRFTSAILTLALGVLSCTFTAPTAPREATNAVTYWQHYRRTYTHRTVELHAPATPNVTGQKVQP